MNALDHALAWLRGELVEQASIGIYGSALLALAVLFWRFGALPAARALILPFLIVGSLFVALGVGGAVMNSRRGVEYARRYEENPRAFVAAEQARTAEFLTWYPWTLGAGSTLITAGLLLFNLARTPTPRGIALGLLLFGLGGLLIDSASEANGRQYAGALASISR